MRKIRVIKERLYSEDSILPRQNGYFNLNKEQQMLAMMYGKASLMY
jgi:hypothetical protein